MDACPDPSALEAFGRGALDPASRERVEIHLDRCSACASVLGQLAALWGSTGAIRATHAEPMQSMHRDLATGGAAPRAVGAMPADLVVGRYRLGRLLGAGAMGVVYEASDPELHRRVAIKLLHPESSGDIETTRTRMLREARAMAQLAHPNVVAVHDVGRFGEQVFVAMELVEGITLTRWLQTSRRTRADIVAMFVQAGRGLQAAHAVGLVHRDFKPDNVLIGVDGRARVTDFGLARPAMAFPVQSAASDTGSLSSLGATADMQTVGGAIVGTPAFMAPEQWRGQVADARSDQFAFSVALFDACFGARPFQGEGVYGLAEAVLGDRMTPPPRGAPRWLRAALVRGLAADPAKRHPSMAELLDELEHDRTRWRRVAALVGAMGASVAATVAVFAWTADATSASPSVGVTLPDPGTTPDAADTTGAPVDAPAPPPVVDGAKKACATRLADAQSRWNVARRTKLADAIAGMDQGEAIAARALPVLDRWASAWTTAAIDACADPAELAAAACLQRHLVRFDAFVQQSLDLPTFQVDDSIAAGAHRLPDLETCTAPGWLATPVAAVPEAKVAAAALITEELARGEALVRLDRLTGAPEAIATSVERAAVLGWPPLVAEAQLALGDANAEKYETVDAIAAYEAAAAAAHGGVHEAVLARAAVGLVEQHARRLDFVAVERWRQIAAAIASRVDDPKLTARLAIANGLARLDGGEPTVAITVLDEGRASAVAGFGEMHPEVGRMLVASSRALVGASRIDDGRAMARRATEVYEKSVGPTDLRYAIALAHEGRAALAAGDLAVASEIAARAVKIPIFSDSLRHDFDHGTILGLLGDVQSAQGAHDDALATYAKAKIYLYVDAPKAWPVVWHAAERVRGGDVAGGLAELDEARKILDEHLEADDPRRIDPLLAIAAVERTAGKAAAAKRDVAAAMTLAEAKLGYGPRTALVQWELAALEQAEGNDARALELLDDANVPLYTALGADHPRLVDSLLARADLAHALGQADYAGRLYRSIVDRLSALYGPKDARAMRARTRQTSE